MLWEWGEMLWYGEFVGFDIGMVDEMAVLVDCWRMGGMNMRVEFKWWVNGTIERGKQWRYLMRIWSNLMKFEKLLVKFIKKMYKKMYKFDGLRFYQSAILWWYLSTHTYRFWCWKRQQQKLKAANRAPGVPSRNIYFYTTQSPLPHAKKSYRFWYSSTFDTFPVSSFSETEKKPHQSTKTRFFESQHHPGWWNSRHLLSHRVWNSKPIALGWLQLE